MTETKGDPEKAFAESECVLSGECRMNYQEHFYMETQSCLVVPRDGNEYEIYCATQGPSVLQVSILPITHKLKTKNSL